MFVFNLRNEIKLKKKYSSHKSGKIHINAYM